MRFELTILGSGSALPTSLRNTTAQVLNILERFFLIDCGEGSQLQIRKLSLPFSKINRAFISHLHGDHFYGLFGLLSTYNLMGRKKTFYIHAHSDLVQILETVLKIGSQELSYKIEVIPLSFQNPETIFEDSKVKVTSFPLRHSIPVCGFLFEEKPRPRNVIKEFVESMQLTIKEMNELKSGLDIVRDGKVYKNSTLTKDPPRVRKYAFVTDTLKCSNIVEIIKDVDILYHEATYLHKDLDLARLSCHSTALQAAQIAHDSGAKKLLLGHYSSRYTDPKVIEEEAQTVFENSVATADGDVYILDNK
ncbi:MAG: ribonuclease Z [Salinivirgaceae bacterium]|jgi:ribonuclease Z|nr:ribonuclease Z [Bacteroidales bacterium]